MSSYTEGQIHQLANSLEREDFTPDDVTKLGQYIELQAIRGVLRRTHEIKPVAHLINCDAAPYVPDGWSVLPDENDDPAQCQIPNRVKGIFVWDPKAVELYLADEQKDGRIIGTKLWEQLRSKPVLNATVLDYLLKPENQHLIPEEWKSKTIFFWGTIYSYSDDHPRVRCLFWLCSGWSWGCNWLDLDWNGLSHAVLRAR